MKKFFSLSSVMLLLVLLLTACGGEPATSTGQNVTLRYGVWDENQVPALKQMIAEFKKTNTNIDVQVEVTPWEQYWTKLETAATGGGAADVLWMNGPNFIKYASNDIIAPLDEQITADNVDMGKYPEALVQLYTYEGKAYTLPKDFDTVGLWYNKALFDEFGVKYPDDTWDWKTLQDTAKKLTDPNKGVWGIVSQLTDQAGYYNTIFQNGGYVISEDKKTSGYDKPETIEGIKFWTDLIQEKNSPNLAQMTDTKPINLFESGKVAMMYTGSWNAIELYNNEYTKNNVDVTVLPKGKERATVIHGLANVVNSSTQHPQEAWEFIKFLGSKEAAEINAKTKTGMPAYEGTQDAWVKSMPGFNLQIFVDELEYAVPYPTSKNTAAWIDAQTRNLTPVWSGQKTPEDGAKELAQQMNQLLADEQK